MRLDVSMTVEKDELSISSWWAKTPDFALSTLRSQLEAATVIWPELAEYKIVKRRDRSKKSDRNAVS